ncbi:MAG: hypothetical protein E4H43_05325 [Bacteroidia bacterium]|nr:MAG: hypothetical protein E4H43_05325 [Bacteroidia bacterium]
MLLKKFRETGPDVVILIVIILLLTWLGAFLHPHLPSDQGFDVKPMPLFSLLMAVSCFSPFFSVFVAFLLVILISILLVNFNTSAFFISERTFIPALLYGLLSAYVPQYQILNPVLPSTVLLILGIRKIIDSYKVQGTAFSFFDAGILISVGSLFYAGLIWFGILLIIGMAIIRNGSLKEILISIIGLVTPLFIVYGFMYVTGKDMDRQLSAVTYNLFAKDAHYSIPGLTLVVLITAGTIVLISVIHLLSVINAKKTKSRKTFILLLWTFLITFIVYFLFKTVSAEIQWIIVIPPVYFLSHYFVFSRAKRLPEIMLSVLFVLAALIQIVNLLH